MCSRSHSGSPGAGGWQARLELGLTRGRVGACESAGAEAAGTVLSHRLHRGPLLVQKPFYPEHPKVCHLYIIHPPGGVVGGDRLELDVELGEQAHALLTTPAAGKFYRSDGRLATQAQLFRLASGAALEWLPQENIYFDQARIVQNTDIHLQPGSRYISWELACLGRPAAQESFGAGNLCQSLNVYCNQRPILVERNRIEAGTQALAAVWGYQGRVVSGTFSAFPLQHEVLEAVRECVRIATTGRVLCSVTLKNQVLVCRYLGDEVESGRRFFIDVWKLVRRAMFGIQACAPRIWRT